MRILKTLSALLFLTPVLAWGWGDTLTANGNYPDANGIRCYSGKGRAEVFDGGSGYDSGVVTLQFRNANGDWENACPTSTDCQWSSGDSGAVPFDMGADARVRFNLASVASASDIDAGIVCASN